MYLFGNSYFETTILKQVFQAVFLFFIFSEFGLWLFIFLNNKKQGGNRDKGDKGSYFLLIAGFIAIIFLNAAMRKSIAGVLPIPLFWIGSLLIVFGVILRAYSVFTLRKFFTLTVQINSKQKIIQTGPYKYIRHPAYSGSILSLMGLAFCFRGPWGVIATLLVITIIYGYRIGVEERLLSDQFMSEYDNYKKKTKRIIPFIW